MQLQQRIWSHGRGWSEPEGKLGTLPKLVFAFGAPLALRAQGALAELRQMYPNARVIGCSTAGEIAGTHVLDDSIVATAVSLETTRVESVETVLDGPASSHAAGRALGQRLAADELVHVFVLSDGLAVNGSDLVKGLASALPAHVGVTGGLAADGDRFEHSWVCLDGEPAEHRVVAMGLYGKRLKVGCGSLGGWDPFGPERRVTRSKGNVLYTLDGQSALKLYKEYLGEHAAGLPSSGLLFPLAVGEAGAPPVVRTILAVNEDDQSLTFAGDVPEGSVARLMRANFDRLIDGATGAAQTSHQGLGAVPAQLAILISCVGRKLVLKQRIEDEVEGVRQVLGPQAMLTGFYSYGEISPFTPSARCELHNQTMTITTFAEV